MVGLPDGMALTIAHCGEPMRNRSTGTTWEGEYEVTTLRFVCGCGFIAEVACRENVG